MVLGLTYDWGLNLSLFMNTNLKSKVWEPTYLLLMGLGMDMCLESEPVDPMMNTSLKLLVLEPSYILPPWGWGWNQGWGL